MKLTGFFILFFLISGPLISQDIKNHIVTKTFYNRWNVTYSDGQLYEYHRGADTRNVTQNGITILYLSPTMIDDGIYGTEGVILTKDKQPEYVLGLSFPVGIGNKSYEDLVNDTMSIRILLTSGKDSLFSAVSYESAEDEVTVGGNEFKGRLYRFLMDSAEFNGLKNHAPNRLQIYFKGKPNKAKPRRSTPGGYISSDNAMISKFSTWAHSIDKIKILEIK